MDNISKAVELARSVDFFCFAWRSRLQGGLRAVRAIDEFLVQCGVEVDANASDSNDEPAISLNVTDETLKSNERDGFITMARIGGTDTIIIFPEFGSNVVLFRGNGTVVIDFRDKEHTDGGYIVSQPGTAFGRVLGQGLEPREIVSFENVSYTETPLYLRTLVNHELEIADLEPIDGFMLRHDGALEYRLRDSDTINILTGADLNINSDDIFMMRKWLLKNDSNASFLSKRLEVVASGEFVKVLVENLNDAEIADLVRQAREDGKWAEISGSFECCAEAFNE